MLVTRIHDQAESRLTFARDNAFQKEGRRGCRDLDSDTANTGLFVQGFRPHFRWLRRMGHSRAVGLPETAKS
jgi:hypothetical protein